jgi:hypothetical protein
MEPIKLGFEGGKLGVITTAYLNFNNDIVGFGIKLGFEG